MSVTSTVSRPIRSLLGSAGASTTTLQTGLRTSDELLAPTRVVAPTQSEIFEELYSIYEDPAVVARLMNLFKAAADSFAAVRRGDRKVIKAVRQLMEKRNLTGRGYHAFVVIPDSEDGVHKLLERIMVDRANPRFGSTHARVNGCFLPDGYAFIHDYAKGCIVAVA